MTTPRELLTLLARIWHDKRHVRVALTMRDAWATVAVIQHATRNPQLSAEQRETAIAVGRAIQGALQSVYPETQPYIDVGWDKEGASQ